MWLLLALMVGCDRDPLAPRLRDGAVLVVDDVHAGWPGGATILSATVVNDSLRIDTEFGGGCRDHWFALLVATGVAESLPAQGRMRLAHEGHGDTCRALLSRTVSFDLAIVRAHFRPAGAPRMTIAFSLDGFSAPILYSF